MPAGKCGKSVGPRELRALAVVRSDGTHLLGERWSVSSSSLVPDTCTTSCVLFKGTCPHALVVPGSPEQPDTGDDNLLQSTLCILFNAACSASRLPALTLLYC